MSSLTLARLRRIAAAAGGRERRLTIVTGLDRRRWAAWPYGCVELDEQRQRWLDQPVDGCHRWRADGLVLRMCGATCDLVVLREEMLPLLTATGRTAVTATKWMYEDDGHVRRLLERSDGAHAVVDADFWQLWTAAVDSPAWQVGGRNGWLVWAASATAPGVAALGSVRAEMMPPLPEVSA